MTDFTPPTSQPDPPGLVGALNLPSLSDIYIDGIPVSSISADDLKTVSGKETQATHFWATPMALPDDVNLSQDVFEVSFSAAERINCLQFQLAHFPHNAYVEYFNATLNAWIQVTQTNGLAGNIAITDSIPATCWTAPIDNNHTHPQHFGAGHWLTYNLRIIPVVTAQIRLRLFRTDSPSAPKDPFGNNIPYSLGVKDFQADYIVSSALDIPIVGPSNDSVRETNPIGSSTDLLGSPVDFVVRTNDARELLNQTGVWRCEPQPVANCVVNLYSDMRTKNGNPQVFDRIYMNPLFSGATVNIYYSNDTTEQTTFQANDNPITGNSIALNGSMSPPQTLSDGISMSGNCSIALDNTIIQFDQTKPFQFGLIFRPQFASTDLNPRTIYDDDNLTITWGPSLTYPPGVDNQVNDITGNSPSNYGGFTITFLGTNVLSVPMSFNAGTAIQWYLTWDGTNFRLDQPETQAPNESIQGVTPPGITPSVRLSFGGAISNSYTGGGNGDITLRAVILKVGNPDGRPQMESFWNNPDAFVVTPESGPSTTTENAILRFSPLQISTVANPWGLLGGPSVVFDSLSWIPITRSYKLTRGFCDFEPINCRFVKFEFSNLSAQPYETSTPVTTEIKMFPNNIAPITGMIGPSNQVNQETLDTHAIYASWNRFTDQVNLASNNAIPPYAGLPYLPTEAKFSADPETAKLLSDLAPYWNFQNQHQNILMPQFQIAGTHKYQTAVVPFERRVAYFIGLSNLQFFRKDLTTDEDTSHWLELFYDDQYIEYPDPVNKWVFEDETGRTGIATPEDMTQPVQITSAILNSYRVVRGFQYATTQTPAVQLIPDADFNDPSLQHWEPYGAALISSDSFYDKSIGGVAKVSLGSTQVLWSDIEQTYGSWAAIESSSPLKGHPTWADLGAGTFISQSGGIATADMYTPSTVGRIFVAARVITPKGLSTPLTLDLINGDGTVLASVDQVVSGNMTEFWLEYRIGDTPITGQTWDQVESDGTYNQVEAIGTWDQVANRPEALVIENLKIALYQKGTSRTETWYVDNLSLFDDAIVWEFSRDGGQHWYQAYDIMNNANGVFIFPGSDASTPGGGSQFLWRLTGGASNLNVSSLSIRPWYDSLYFGKRPTRLNTYGGPNLSPYDHFPDTIDDPRFKMWSSPIPQDWFFEFREKFSFTSAPVLAQGYASDAIAGGTNEGLPPAPGNVVLPVSIVYGV